MKSLFVRFVREEAGQDLIEYALIAAFVCLAAVVGAKALAAGLNTWYQNMGSTLSTMPSAPPAGS